MTGDNLPLISCLCVSHNSVELLARAVNCFVHQTYRNKQLVVVYTADNFQTTNYLKQLHNPSIKQIEIPANTFNLGEKRNLAINECDGKYFCVWDDDDWYSNNRLEFQFQRLTDTQFKCNVLSQVLVYDSLKEEAHLSGKRWAWEQTLLCEKSVTKNPALRYASLDRGEDSALIMNLREHDLHQTISNPSLYVYIYHGANTWQRKHWEDNILRWGTKLSMIQSNEVKAILGGAYHNNEATRIAEDIIASVRE